jgi:tetratricopeptide (TPR) repeat protein
MVRLYGATGAPLRTRRSRLEVLAYRGVVEFTDKSGALTSVAAGHLLLANRELQTLRLEPKAYSRLISVSGGWGRRQDVWRIRTWSVVDLLLALDAPRVVLGADLGPVPEGEAGLEVLAVAPGSNAERAGITTGDRITQLGDRAIETLGDVAAGELLLASELEPTVTVRRDGVEVALKLPVAPKAPVLSGPADGDIRALAALAAGGGIEQAAARCLELVDADPMCAGHWYNLGALREYQRRWADALAAYKKAESLRPGQLLLLTALGRVYGRIGNLTRARTALLAADELRSCGTVRYLLGRVAILGTDLGEAEFWSNDLLASAPDDDRAWGELLAGQLAYIRGDVETAQSRFGNAARLDPANLLGTLYLAAATDALGHRPPTRELLRPVLRVWPDLLAAVNLMGMAAFWERDWAEAGRWYERGIALEPDSPALLCNRGMVAEAEGRYDEAIECYEEALGADVSFVRAHTDLGDVTAKTGRLDQAAQHYEEALRLAPGDSDLLDRAVAVCEQLGEEGRAQQLIQRYGPEGGCP